MSRNNEDIYKNLIDIQNNELFCLMRNQLWLT